MELILYIITSVSISIIFTTEYVFNPIHKLPWRPFIKKLLSCSPCFSFHVGWVLYLIWKPFYIGELSFVVGGLIVYLTTKIISIWISNNSFTIK